jgi:hypothetical protein
LKGRLDEDALFHGAKREEQERSQLEDLEDPT